MPKKSAETLVAYAIRKTASDEYVVFGSGCAEWGKTVPSLDIRCLRTEKGAKSWLRSPCNQAHASKFVIDEVHLKTLTILKGGEG